MKNLLLVIVIAFILTGCGGVEKRQLKDIDGNVVECNMTGWQTVCK